MNSIYSQDAKKMEENTVAVVFPGQGAQRKGMGRDFFDTVPSSRQVFEEASDTLGWDVAGCCFNGSEKLDMTEYAQPCILTTEIAMFRALETLYGFQAQFFGGHSLGEYTALVAANVMPFARAVRTVQIRGRLMQAASPKGTGSMAAVIMDNLDQKVLERVLDGTPVDAANINCCDQVVISGESKSVANAEAALRRKIGQDGSLRFVPLNVSAPFHSRFMKSVENDFRKVLQDGADSFCPENAFRVISNFTGKFHSPDREAIINNLVSQISHPVLWQDNMTALAATSEQIFEIGPNRPLRRFFKSMGIDCTAIITLQAAKRLFETAG